MRSPDEGQHISRALPGPSSPLPSPSSPICGAAMLPGKVETGPVSLMTRRPVDRLPSTEMSECVLESTDVTW